MRADHADTLISNLATPQYGLVTTAGMMGAGLTESELRTRIASGQLHRVFRTVYRVSIAALDRETLFAASLLRLGADAALVDHSAAELSGLLVPLRDWIHVGLPKGRRSQQLTPELPMLDGSRPRVIARYAPRLDTECELVQVGRSTIAARTLVDLAGRSPQRFHRAWREAGYLGLLDVGAVARVLDAGRYRGRDLVTAKLAAHQRVIEGDHGLDSPAEFDAIQLVLAAGMPHPLVNHWIQTLTGRRRADLFWLLARLAVEIDGWDGHSSPESFVDDRVRDNELLQVGILTMRFAATFVRDNPQLVADQILQQLILRTPAGTAS